MKLSFNEIEKIATGAVRIEEENGSVKLYRFTKQQEELYKSTLERLYKRTFSTAGIKLLFKTDSKNLFLKLKVEESNVRKYFSVDIFVNGKPFGFIDNFSGTVLPKAYTSVQLPLGVFEKNFEFNEGEKTVCVYLPWSVRTTIEEISIDDGASLEEIKFPKTLLAFGDSITHGFDALRPSNRHISKLAEKLGAIEYNKAVGGEMFFPELAKTKDLLNPDYVIVAYGSNDWNNIDEKLFMKNCKAFFENLHNNYPDSMIFAITPVWRKDYSEERTFGDFHNVEKNIREIVSDIDNITLISGFDLVPHDENLYGDLYLHPNDKGFEYYFENLFHKIKQYI